MANVFTGVDGAPSGDQINLTFQKMAGMIEKYVEKYFYLIPKFISNRGGSESSPGTR